MSTTSFNANDLVIHQRTELVFIDGNVPDIDTLIASIGPDKEVHVLDASQDGLTQMLQVLESRSNIDALHIISHGSQGNAQLGTLALDSNMATTRAADLQAIGRHLTDSGDILFYGCDIGAGQEGTALIEQLAITTGADIAASDDLTGNAALGGNWDLEVVQGSIETPVSIDAGLANLYFDVLAIASSTVDFSVGANHSYVGSPYNVVYKIAGNSSYQLTFDGAVSSVDTGGQRASVSWSGNETSFTTSLANGKFDITSLILQSSAAQTLKLYGFDKDNVLVGQTYHTFSGAAAVTKNLGWTNVQKLQIFPNGGTILYCGLDDLVLTNITLFNAAPTIGGITTTTTIDDTATTTPFSGVTIADADNNNVSVTVTPDVAAKGVFTAESLTASGFSTSNGGVSYTLASTTPANAQTAIRQLVFNPTDNRVAPGSIETTTFTIAVNDGTATTNNSTTTVTATSVNDAPTDIALSSSTVTVYDAANATVGTLSTTDVDSGDTHAYTLVAGTGDTNNGLFNISGSSLRATDPANIAPGTYSVRVRTTDAASATYEEALSITVTGALIVTTNLDSGADATTGGSYAAELADGGGLSLREALAIATAAGGGKTIGFAAALDGQTILLQDNTALSVPAGTVLDADAVNNLTIRYDYNVALNTAGITTGTNFSVHNGAGDRLILGPFNGLNSSGTITKTGAGTLAAGASPGGSASTGTLGGFSGIWDIQAGTLELGRTNGMTPAALTIAGGAVLDPKGFAQTFTSLSGAGSISSSTANGQVLVDIASGGRSIFSGGLAGTPSLTLKGSGTLEWQGTTTSTTTGQVEVQSQATLELNKASGTVGASRFQIGSDGGTTPDSTVLRWLASNQVTTSTQYWIYNSGLLDLNGYNQTASSTIRFQGAGEIRTGTGTLALSGASVTQASSGTADINGLLSLASGTNSTFTTGTGLIDVSANISGAGGLVVAGTGILQLGGTASYSGTTAVNAGTLRIAGDSNIGSGALQLGGGTLLVTGSDVTIDNSIALTTSTSSTINNANSLTLSGQMTGSGNLAKSGAGTLILSNTTSTNSGTVTVNAGVLQLDGKVGGGVTVAGGTLAGGGASTAAGEAAGDVSIDSGGTLSPGANGGADVADLKTGNLTVVSGGTLAMTLNGATTAGTDYDQIITTGTVNVTGATLSVSGSATAAPGTVFTLISNDGTDAVTGTFNGLAEGATVTVNGVGMTISYAGGTDNNDITLTRQAVNMLMANLNGDSVAWAGVGNAVSLDASTNLTVADDTHDASNWNDVTLTVQRSGTAVTSDTFAIAAGTGYTVSGSNLQAGGQTFAAFTNANGVLSITFANGGADATNALVQDVLRHISYQNDTPAGNATIRFTLADNTNSSTADVTVTTDKIYVTTGTDTAADNLNDGVSFSEALRIANAQTGTETLMLASSLASQTVGAANVASLSGSVIVDADAASGATISGGSLVTTGHTLTFTNGTGDTLTVSTTLTGTGNIAKTGAGTTLLSGTNNYSGTTSITGGRLTATNGSSFGTSAVTLDGATINFGETANVTLANAITLGAGGGTLQSASSKDGIVSGGISGGGNLTIINRAIA